MDAKKDNSPHRKSFPFATVIAILTGITSLLIFLTGKSSLPDILEGEPASATPTFTPTVTRTVHADTPTIAPSPTVTLVSGSETAAATKEIRLVVQAPSDSELETMPSLWTLTHFKELSAPGSNGYTVEVTHDSSWIWDCYFCASNDAFQEFLSTLTLEFRINDAALPVGSLRVRDRKGKTGWLCRDWAALVSGWPLDRSVFLEIHYTHSKKASDGEVDFDPGEYSQLIVVVVKG